MPRNLKGGKNYKKMAKGSGVFDIDKFRIDRQEGQQIARVIRVLGNLNMSCYCNDGMTRICKIRGKMIKREFVEQGDYVLISLRDLEEIPEEDKKKDLRGDILAKYPHEYIPELRKEEGLNSSLFVNLESLIDGKMPAKMQEDGFIFDNGSDDDTEGANTIEQVQQLPQVPPQADKDTDEDVDIGKL